MKNSIPKELQKRRDMVTWMYKEGFCLLDIARYFEIPIPCARKSLNAEGMACSEKENGAYAERDIEPLGERIAQLILKRDKALKGASLEDAQREGFWRVPIAYASMAQEEDEAVRLQKELLDYGITRKYIAVYFQYPESSMVNAHRKSNSAVLKQQKTIADKLIQDCGWSVRHTTEFTGIPLSRLYSKKRLSDDDGQNEKPPRYLRYGKHCKLDTIASLHKFYREDDKRTYSDVIREYLRMCRENGDEDALQIGISRRTLIAYFQNYEKHILNGVSFEKRVNKKGNQESKKKEVCARLLDSENGYFVSDGHGKYKRTKKKSQERIAWELGVSELTVAKYMRMIEQSEGSVSKQ